MLFLIGAWILVAFVAIAAGWVILRMCRCHPLRIGDRALLSFWLGLVVLAVALLAVSLVAPVTPLSAALVAALILGGTLVLRAVLGGEPGEGSTTQALRRREGRMALAAGVALIAAGAALLASDPATLYDSLVYHVGAQKWMREHGLVSGLALIHIRLGHVSSWLALGAPFDGAPATGRASNVAMGLTTLVLGLQAALATRRLVRGTMLLADWVLLVASAALLWAAVALGAASPSPDVGANALVMVVVWAMLVTARAENDAGADRWGELATPRLVPFIVAAGAMTVKLFALPAAAVAAAFYIAPSRRRVARAAVCAAVGGVLLAPFLLAGLITSGCPLFPSPLGCLSGGWSIGEAEAATYADYIRQVARWESRQFLRDAPALAWLAGWVGAHPIITFAIVLTPVVAARLLRQRRHPGARWAMLAAVSGVAFAAWQAPAPRFLFAYVVLVAGIAVGSVIAPAVPRARSPFAASQLASRGWLAFVLVAAGIALSLAVASQKLNVRSAVASRAPLVVVVARDLLLPAPTPPPDSLYRWRVNDFDLFTPAAPAIADTLSYHSVIDGDLGFEKCSAAPLPCTPYLPTSDVRLRRRASGISGGFTRLPRADMRGDGRGVRCIGAVRRPDADGRSRAAAMPDASPADSISCGRRAAASARRVPPVSR